MSFLSNIDQHPSMTPNMLIFSFWLRFFTRFVNFSRLVDSVVAHLLPIFTSEWWLQKALYGSMGIFINKGAIWWLPTVCKSPAFFLRQRPGSGTSATNDPDRFLTASFNGIPQRGTEEKNPRLKLKILPWVSPPEDHAFFWAGAVQRKSTLLKQTWWLRQKHYS